MSKSRKHGVFAVCGDEVVLPQAQYVDIRAANTVATAIEVNIINLYKS